MRSKSPAQHSRAPCLEPQLTLQAITPLGYSFAKVVEVENMLLIRPLVFFECEFVAGFDAEARAPVFEGAFNLVIASARA